MSIPPFAHVAAASYAIPVIVGLRYWRNFRTPLKAFTIFCIYSLLHVIGEYTLGRMGISNQFLLNIHHIVELSAILYVLHSWLREQWMKDLIQYFGMAYILLWFINKSFFEDPMRFSTVISVTALVMFIFTSVIVLLQLLRIADNPLKEYTIFWFALGVLLYASGTIAVDLLSNTIMEMGIEYFNVLWHINWGFTIVSNLLFSRSFACKRF